MFKQISDNEIYLLIKYTDSVLWRVAKRLSHTEDARCLKVNIQNFQKVWHEGLLYKLNTFLPDNMYKILQSYLTNRYFRTKYREAYSSLRQILAGIPQGSVLGSLLYLNYITDLPTLATSTTAIFADDTAS